MKYKVEKENLDGRIWTRGVLLPDGFYRVMNLTRKNYAYLQGLEGRGYILTEMGDADATPCGIYEEDTDKMVTEQSAHDVAMAVPNAKLKYLTKAEAADYKPWTETLGLGREDFRRERGLSRAQREAEKVRADVKKSRDSGLRDVAGMMGVKATAIGSIEDAVREKLGS